MIHPPVHLPPQGRPGSSPPEETNHLIELDGKNLRKEPIEKRKHALANVLCREHDGVIFNQHYDGDGAIIYKQACNGKASCQSGSATRTDQAESIIG
jgi:hypothetical protein